LAPNHSGKQKYFLQARANAEEEEEFERAGEYLRFLKVL
jgi:hypothetical protein